LERLYEPTVNRENTRSAQNPIEVIFRKMGSLSLVDRSTPKLQIANGEEVVDSNTPPAMNDNLPLSHDKKEQVSKNREITELF
jgi:hypothetical protein